MALTSSQEHILKVFARLEGASSFALAGGGAMNVLGVNDRITHDLDLFTAEAGHIGSVADTLIAALRAEGAVVERTRDVPDFVQIIVDDGSPTVVELAHDYRWLDAVATDLGLVLDVRELAADKMCALFGRAETRDVLDVVALLRRFSIEELTGWAREKDAGFDVDVTIEMLTAMTPDLAGLKATAAQFDEMRIGVIDKLTHLDRRSDDDE